MADPALSSVSKSAIVTKVAELEQRLASLASLREKQEEENNQQQQEIKDLRDAVTKLQADISSLTVRVCELESWVEEKYGELKDREHDEEEDLIGLTQEQAKAVRASQEAAKSNSLKASYLSSCQDRIEGLTHLYKLVLRRSLLVSKGLRTEPLNISAPTIQTLPRTCAR
jgi:chromosome segregation ATPase